MFKSDFTKSEFFSNLTIIAIHDDNGIINIEGNLDNEPKFTLFKLTSFSADHFNIFYQDKNTVYNISVKL